MATDTFEIRGTVAKVDESLGLVFGFGAIATKNGEPYIDAHDEHTTEAELLKALLNFVENWQVAGEEHTPDPADPNNVIKRGSVPFVFPLLADVAKALGITTKRTGALVALKPDAAMMAKYKDGTLTGFSMGGTAKRRPMATDG